MTTAALEQLVRRSGTRDRKAFAELYDATAPRLFGLALRLLPEPSDAMDVVTSSYVDIWREARHFDPARGSALAWMTAALHTRAVARLRQEGGAAGSGRAAAPVRPAHPEGSAHRSAMSLTYYEGRTHTETAAEMNLSVPEVDLLLRQPLAGQVP